MSLQCIDEDQVVSTWQAEMNKKENTRDSSSSVEVASDALDVVDYSSDDHSSHDHVFHAKEAYESSSDHTVHCKTPDSDSPDGQEVTFPGKKPLQPSKSLPLAGLKSKDSRNMTRNLSEPSGHEIRPEQEEGIKKSKHGFKRSTKKKKEGQSNEDVSHWKEAEKNQDGIAEQQEAETVQKQEKLEKLENHTAQSNGDLTKTNDLGSPIDDLDVPTTPKKSIMRRFSERLRSLRTNQDEEENVLPTIPLRKAKEGPKFSVLDMTNDDATSQPPSRTITYNEHLNLGMCISVVVCYSTNFASLF